MLMKFISVSETRFQNTETTLKNQQALPSNTETNPREQLHVITVRDKEGLVEDEPKSRQEDVVGDDTIKLQARDSVRISSNRDDITSSVNVNNLVAKHSLQKTPRKNVTESQSSLHNKNRTNHEERRLQIDELDEWQTYVKKKPRIHDEPKRLHDELKDGMNQFKIGDQALLDKTDPRITTSELNANGATPFTVLNIFPTVQSR
ncbi:hypothetical protein GOBAR_AA12191 [Gossypium barbadense]|uniref:Uncharacterized protein n=1 Tax=Gossypium barbadense TaxID=3634 RepID=A0A2P5XYN8_GOSBA|nr:hypothetical protein GOBAR_AA12191 [Gossypium barbadense]